MTTDRPKAAGTDTTVTSADLSYLVRRRIFLYLGILIVLLSFGAPGSGLIDIPITFLLKNKLHLKAHELADFRLVSAIPLYVSFAFGFIRDTWNPFGMRGRGFMLLFGALTAGLYILFAFTPLTYGTLLAAVCLYTNAPGTRFVIDRHPEHERVIFASPCSGHGFKYSAAIGEALADRLRNRPAKVDLSPFDLRHIS